MVCYRVPMCHGSHLRRFALTFIGDIPLVSGRVLKICHAFLNTRKLTPEGARRSIEGLVSRGAKVIVGRG